MSPTSALRNSARGKALALLIAIAAAALALPGAASAADSIYWSNYLGGKISHANLDGGGGGGDLATPGVSPEFPTGVAIDATAGRIYWADRGAIANAIYFTNLDGSGGGKVFTGAATVSEPYGLAIDPAAGKLYWANSDEDAISYANLDGTGGGDLYTVASLSGATLNDPRGLAIDRAANRIYWANFEGGAISYANLDGTGGATDLDTTGVTIAHPTGLAIDATRVYWTNETPEGIFYANLDGGGAGQLSTTGAEVNGPAGIAIDPGAARVFWANAAAPSTISYAGLNGGSGGALNTSGATLESPHYLALLRAPQAAPTVKVPEISGQHLIERPLYCSKGAWAADLLGSYLYRAPQSYSYAWSRNGVEIAGAGQSNYRPTRPGTYNCMVTAANAAGSTTQASADLTLMRGFALSSGFAPVRGRKALVTLTCAGDGRCKGVVKLIAHVGYRRVVHRNGHRKVIRRRALFPIGKARFSIYPGRTKVLRVKLKRKAKRLLIRKRGHRMRVRLLGRDVQHRGLLLKAGGRSSALARTGHRRPRR